MLIAGLAGVPLVHQEQVYEFDPEVSQKRRALYNEVMHIIVIRWICESEEIIANRRLLHCTSYAINT